MTGWNNTSSSGTGDSTEWTTTSVTYSEKKVRNDDHIKELQQRGDQQ
jgi:hypothetical protein